MWNKPTSVQKELIIKIKYLFLTSAPDPGCETYLRNR